MATPMLMIGRCGLCFGPDEGGTWDLDDGPYRAVLVNVCYGCRINENRQLILLRSAYQGNGHGSGCVCLECMGAGSLHSDHP